MQFQADILDRQVLRPAIRETTALGAACLAGLAVGVWRDSSELRSLRQPDIPFQPSMEDARRTELLRQWHRAVERCRGWAE